MGTWSAALFADDIALDIKREYSILLSVGKSNEEAEQMLINYYSSILNCNDPDEDVFWFVLALSEWKKGRLSPYVKKKALQAIEDGNDLKRWDIPGNERNYKKRKKVLQELKETLTSPMPPQKNMRKPSVKHCPWKVGSLLAYKIVSDKEYLQDKRCKNKYVLLRIVRISRRPISSLFDTGYYDESMLVGLYNWIGDAIPDPKIVQDLEYVPLDGSIKPPPHLEDMDTILSNSDLPEEFVNKMRESVQSLFSKFVEKCVWLDWRISRELRREHREIMTMIDYDENFQYNIPEFFGANPNSRTYTHSISFDGRLVEVFEPLL